MRQISAVIITKNEERNIGRCLDSLAGVADQILVVDSSSTDDTVNICREKGAQVYTRSWHGYSDQKNWGNDQAEHDWILSIDADEALSDELKESIVKARSADQWNYSMARLANYCGQWIHHSGWYPDRKFRLFDRRQTKWRGDIHETLVTDGDDPKLLRGDLLHYSYYTIDEHVAQANRFSGIAARSMYVNATRPSLVNVLFNPFFRFFKFYFLKRGFLDGFAGFTISSIAAYEVFLKYTKLWWMHINDGK